MPSPDRDEFDKQLAILCAAFDVPCTEARREAYWKSLERMPVAVFARTIEHMLREEDWVRIPKPAQIWHASRRLRASGPTRPPDDGFRGDAWDMAANRHLLAYLLEHRIPGRGPSSAAMRDKARLADKVLDASPEFVQNVKVLVAYKNAWVTDMRDEAVNGEVPVARQQETWAGCMKRAESELRP